MFMQWIKENSIITIAVFISLIFHSIVMLYHKEEHIIKEDIITFEIVKQVANTQIAQEIKQNEPIENKVEEKQEIVKKEEIHKEALVKKENMIVSEAELDAVLKETADKYNKSVEDYKKSLDNRTIAYFQNDILMKKLLDFLKTNNNII